MTLPRLAITICLLLWGGLLLGQSEQIKTTWAELPALRLPDLENAPRANFRILVTDVPAGAIGQVNTYSPCGLHCNWECDASHDGSLRLLIQNGYGYGERFLECDEPISLEFLQKTSQGVKQYCKLQFHVEGDHRLPLLRIGDVLIQTDTIEADTVVRLYPILEFVFPGHPFSDFLRPHFVVFVTCEGMEPIRMEGWNDCGGAGLDGKQARMPCKVPAIPISMLRACNGIVTVRFEAEIDFPDGALREAVFRVEDDDPEFRYDVFNDKLVER